MKVYDKPAVVLPFVATPNGQAIADKIERELTGLMATEPSQVRRDWLRNVGEMVGDLLDSLDPDVVEYRVQVNNARAWQPVAWQTVATFSHFNGLVDATAHARKLVKNFKAITRIRRVMTREETVHTKQKHHEVKAKVKGKRRPAKH